MSINATKGLQKSTVFLSLLYVITHFGDKKISNLMHIKTQRPLMCSPFMIILSDFKRPIYLNLQNESHRIFLSASYTVF